VDENKRPLGMIGRNINRRQPHKRSSPVDQRIRRNARFVTIEAEVNVHAKSLHEAGMHVKLKKNKNLRQISPVPAEAHSRIKKKSQVSTSRFNC
jgi:hypothetical protein